RRVFVEVVGGEDGEVRELARLDGAQTIFFLEEPAVRRGVEAERLAAVERLIAVARLAAGVLARPDVVDADPRIHGRYLHAVRAHADRNAAFDEHAKRRTVLLGRAADIAPAAEHADSGTERAELVRVLASDERRVREHPAKLGDAGRAERRVDALPAVDDRHVVSRCQRVVLVAPARLRNEPRAVLPRLGRLHDDRARARRELADA